jgi:hypothetical protein
LAEFLLSPLEIMMGGCVVVISVVSEAFWNWFRHVTFSVKTEFSSIEFGIEVSDEVA